MKRTLSAAMSLLLAASASAQVPASAAAKIGTAAAVAGSVKAAAAGAAVGRVISSGKPLFLNDHVTTNAAGRLQVLLLDETIFTLGPNSDMVLDEFVYDPKSGAGKVDAAISKGTFRFVTGRIAQKDPSKLKIKVAVGTIGVRGSIGVGETGPDGTIIINGGARNPDNHDDSAGIYAENGGRIVNLPQPGVGTRIHPDGGIDKAGFLVADLNRIMGGLEAHPGAGNGGEHAGLGGGKSATETSGRSTAIGGALAGLSADTLALGSDANSAMTLANQQSTNSNALATWDQVRSITAGNGTYTGSGNYTCLSGSCGSGGTFDFSIPVSFATRQISSGGSIQISGGVSDTGNISSPISYANASGQAVQSLNGAILGSQGGNNWNGTTVSFLNHGGITAGGMTVDLHYTNTQGSPNPVIAGTATGNR